MFKKYPIHPFLFILFSVISLYSSNLDRVVFSEVFRLIIVLEASTAVFIIAFRLLSKSWFRSGLICTIFILFFSTYAHIYHLLSGIKFFGVSIGQANYIAAVWAALLILFSWSAIRVVKNPKPLNEILNIVSIMCLIFPFLQISISKLSHPLAQQAGDLIIEEQKTKAAFNQTSPPDIYYIILDEYGREDVLNEVMSYDNSELIQYLRQKGFYVADRSRSNYIITHLSLASSLNFQYLDMTTPPGSKPISKVINKIKNNEIASFLKRNGYTTVTFATGYDFSDMNSFDYHYVPKNYINDFELSYMENTGLAIFTNYVYFYRFRSLLLNAFEGIERAGEVNSTKPKFVYAHILATHVPFVFGSNGEPVPPWTFSTTGRTYTSTYLAQLTFVNKKIISTIDKILSQSDEKPVIIIQSDHGPESKLDWYSVENSCLKKELP